MMRALKVTIATGVTLAWIVGLIMNEDFMQWFVKGMKVMFYIITPSELALDGSDAKPAYMDMYGLPMFFVFILFEWVAMQFVDVLSNSKNKSSGYRLNDFIMSVMLGTFQAMFLMLLALVGLEIEIGMYTQVYQHFRLWTVDSKEHVIFSYVALLLGKDFCYYCAHRFFHEYHLAWLGHSNHHSGEDYNLATALRQGALQPVFGWPFYLPLALMGFHPNAFAAHAQLNTLFMFWIHTDLIGRMPFGLEYIINTPSAHRMHHRPPGNCNYAGALIIWDRIFCTYTPEIVRKDHYGNGNQPNTFDPIKLNAHHLGQLSRVGGAKRSSSWLYKIFARRVHKKRTFRLGALVDPIPPVAKDVRFEGPKRAKWDGAKPMSVFATAWFLLFGLSSLVFAVLLLVQGAHMHRMDAACGALVSCLLFSALGKIADQESAPTSIAMVVSLFMAIAQFAIVTKKPFGEMGLIDLPETQQKGAIWGSVALLMALGAKSSPVFTSKSKGA